MYFNENDHQTKVSEILHQPVVHRQLTCHIIHYISEIIIRQKNRKYYTSQLSTPILSVLGSHPTPDFK